MTSGSLPLQRYEYPKEQLRQGGTVVGCIICVSMHHRTKMTDERIKALDAIGFRWSVKTGHRSRPKSFASRIEDLKKYKQKHGHLEISLEEDKSLYHFCHNVRTGRKCPGRGTKITDERVKALDEIGFSWIPSKRDRSYEARFEERLEDLRQYKEQHGHLNVSREEDQSLFYFCNNVRYGRSQPGKGMVVTDDRVKALDEIGFTWRAPRNESITTKRKSFESRLEDLRQYKQKHCHLNVTREEDKSLFDFCHNVRYGRNHPDKGMVVTDDRVKALDEIGFPWEVARKIPPRSRQVKKSFESRLEALRQYKQQHGHLNIERKDDKSLYKFCDNIRRRRGNPGKNLMEKIKALDEIGFSWEVARTQICQIAEAPELKNKVSCFQLVFLTLLPS